MFAESSMTARIRRFERELERFDQEESYMDYAERRRARARLSSEYCTLADYGYEPSDPMVQDYITAARLDR